MLGLDLGRVKFCRMFLIKKHNSCYLHFSSSSLTYPFWKEAGLPSLGQWARLARSVIEQKAGGMGHEPTRYLGALRSDSPRLYFLTCKRGTIAQSWVPPGLIRESLGIVEHCLHFAN